MIVQNSKKFRDDLNVQKEGDQEKFWHIHFKGYNSALKIITAKMISRQRFTTNELINHKIKNIMQSQPCKE